MSLTTVPSTGIILSPCGPIELIDGDIIERATGEISASVIVPIYGDPYILTQGKSVSRLRTNSLRFSAIPSTFTALDEMLNTEPVPEITMTMNGDEVFKGILLSVSYTKDLSFGDDMYTGQITYMNVG
jgi:hypothetical protein